MVTGKYYTLKEAGIMLGLQPETVSKYIRNGKLKSRLIGGRRYVTEEDLKDYVLPDKEQ